MGKMDAGNVRYAANGLSGVRAAGEAGFSQNACLR